MANHGIDFGEAHFSFTRERVATAVEYARLHGLTREWRDSHQAGEGLTLRVGPKRASYYARIRVAGKMVGKLLGRADGPERLTVDAARKELTRLRAGVAPTTPKAAKADTGPTLGEVRRQYLTAHAKGTWKPGNRKQAPTETTIANYRTIQDAHLAPHDGKTLAQFAAVMPTVHAELRDTAPFAADHLRKQVSIVYQYATDKGLWSGTNPAVGSKATGLITTEPPTCRTRYLSDDEWEALVDALRAGSNPVYFDLFTISILTGQRMGAVRHMGWADLTLTGKAVCWKIPKEFMKGRRGGHTVPLDVLPEVLEILKRRKKNRDGDSEWVFPMPTDPTQPLVWYRGPWKTAIKRAGLWSPDKNMRPCPHDLRRTCGARMTAARVPLQTTTKALGNSPASVSMVAKVYAQVDDGALSDAFSRAAHRPTT